MTLSSCDSSELAPAVAMTTSSSNDSVDDVTSGGLVELRCLLATVSAVSETHKYLDTLLANQPISEVKPPITAKRLHRKMADCPS